MLEDWLTWFRRATHTAETARKEHNIPDWVDEVAVRKFRWAGHVARRDDGRWTKVVMEWSLVGWRAQGRPVSRWVDSINKYFSGVVGTPVGAASWIAVAQDRDKWKLLEDDYVNFCRKKKWNGCFLK